MGESISIKFYKHLFPMFRLVGDGYDLTMLRGELEYIIVPDLSGNVLGGIDDTAMAETDNVGVAFLFAGRDELFYP